MRDSENTTAAACSAAATELHEILTRFHAFIEPAAMRDDPREYSDLIERLEALAMRLASMGGESTEPNPQLRAMLETVADKIGATLHEEPENPARDQRIAAHVQRLIAGHAPRD